MSTLNLATKNTTDFTVLNSGEAYISRNKAAAILGVTKQAIGQRVSALHPNYYNNQPLTAEMLQQLDTYYAFDAGRYCTGEAQQLAKLLMKAGAKAYIYHEAGYVISATPTPPPQPALPDFSNPATAARAWADKHEALQLETDAHTETKVELHSTVLALEDKTIQLDESSEYYSVKRVAALNGKTWKDYSWIKLKATGIMPVKIFDANYGEVNAYHTLAWTTAYPDDRLK